MDQSAKVFVRCCQSDRAELLVDLVNFNRRRVSTPHVVDSYSFLSIAAKSLSFPWTNWLAASGEDPLGHQLDPPDDLRRILVNHYHRQIVRPNDVQYWGWSLFGGLMS